MNCEVFVEVSFFEIMGYFIELMDALMIQFMGC